MQIRYRSLLALRLSHIPISSNVVNVHRAQRRYPIEQMAEEKSQQLLPSLIRVMLLGC